MDCANALKGLASYVNSGNTASEKRFKQTQDITLTGAFEPLYGVFSGIYDGNNMTISGLYIQQEDRIALFGYLKYATVKNVILLNPSNNALDDADKIASLVGYALTSTIDNCKVINPTLTWKKSTGRCYVGAIVANCTLNSTIKDCYVYSTEYSAYDYHSNTCTIENVGSIFKISVDGCSFTSTATVITVAGTDYYLEGSEIALSHTNRDGYAFVNYTANGTAIDGDTYTIANTDVEFDATWKKLLTHTDITISGISSQTYNGSALTPVVTVQDGNTTLTEGTDYTVKYSNNTNAGTSAKATITGKGNYAGTIEKPFTINPRVTTSGALTLTEYGDRTIAEIQGDFSNISSEGKSLVISESKTVDKVIFKRSFKAGIPATIMLPFGFTPDNDNIGSFYTLESVKYEDGEWIAKTSDAETSVTANTPYIFKAKYDIKEANYLTFNNIELNSTSKINDNSDANGDWTLHGVYQKTMLDGDGIFNYGFAGGEADGISVGDFIRAGKGVWADPMRCYLTYKDGELTTKAATVLPDRIRVVFPDEVNSNNETTDIIENTETEDVVTPVSEFVSESVVKVWSFGGTLYIVAQPDMNYTIVDLSGRTIKKGITHSTHEELNLNTKGIVIVKIGNKSFKLK